ncbi:hypothetical protein TFLX_05930 [Thermoflexales bacterium]|nr:hypothetical protein TFLX_05930 [Thermoflexales bacterium]
MTDEFDEVLTKLEALRVSPKRSEAAARSGLQNFLNEADRLRPAVSARPPRRLTGWISQFQVGSKFTQERSPMAALAIKLVLVLAVIFGGAGVTAAAAQSSLPNEALYPVKLLIEDAQLALASTPNAQIDVQLAQAQQRVHEMVQLTQRDAVIPADVPVRLQTRLQAALQVAAQLGDQQLRPALERIQLRTQDQLREMEQLQVPDAVQALTQAREMAQLGQADPQAFRARFGHGRPDDAPPQPQNTPRADPSGTPVGPRASVTPQHTRTPQTTGTPQRQQTGTPQGPGSGPGPQNTQQPVATPVGQGDGHEYGPGPQSTPQGSGGSQEAPTPSGGGNDTGGNGSGGSGSGSGSGGGRP